MILDKDAVKELITPENVFSLLEFFNGEPEMYDDHIEANTICHNGDSRKLYYYFNSNLFQCFTHCGSFDIIELVQKVNNMEFNDALYFIVQFFKLFTEVGLEAKQTSKDLEYIKNWDELNSIEGNISSQRLNPNPIDLSFLEHYPSPVIKQWKEEGISPEVCRFAQIKYDPVQSCIVIPHFNENGICVGVRQRTLLKEEERWGKYRPYRRGKQLYNHPLSTTLYGLNWSKDRIASLGTAVIVEAEKSVLSSMSIFGIKNNLCIGICGSSFSKYQFNLLMDLNIRELVFAMDKDFKEKGSPEYYACVKKVKALCDKFRGYFAVSCMFDKDNIYLGYKQSPIERGKEVFLKMFDERITSDAWHH